jgi:hypothetical protein
VKPLDKTVYPVIELRKSYPLGAAYKGHIAGVKQCVTINNVCKGSDLIPAQFPQHKLMFHLTQLLWICVHKMNKKSIF